MKVRDIIRQIESSGWVLKNQEGSHRHFVHPTKPGKVTVAGKPGQDCPIRYGKGYHEASWHSRMKRKYAVTFEQGPTGVGAIVPDLPGCFAVGADMREARHLVAEAIEFHIRCLRQAGDAVPPPSHVVEDIEVAA